MASLDSLNDGQRAILQLLLRQGKSYDDLAALLKSDLVNVRMRARDAVAALVDDGDELDPERRNEISDYLLGQQTASQRAATREYLAGSSAGRSWARAAASALSPLDGSLPEIPAEREEVADAFEALDRRAARQVEVERSSQLGSRLIAAGIGVVLAIAIILALSLGGDDDEAARAPAPTTTQPSGTTPTGDAFQVLAQGSLRPPEGGDSTAKGEVAIVRFPESNQFRLALQATGLPPSSTRGSAYGVWLYTSPRESQFLGFPDTVVGRDGKLETVSDLSPDTPNHREVLLTRETAEEPKRPGTIILRGRLITAARQQGQQGGGQPGGGQQGGTQTTP